ncbi:MAG: hypothetical protein ACI4WS_00065 [Oscillospiraceae bacterium]
MKIIFKKTLRGLMFGAMGCAGLYIVFFLIELFGFIKAFFNNTDAPEVVDGGADILDLTMENFSPMMSVWDLLTVFFVAAGFLLVGAIIGFILGCVNRTERVEKIAKYNDSVIEDGSNRQKILFAKEIKTMAETLTAGCNENLYYMKNIVEADYLTGETNEAIMTELTKFIGYEQAVKDFIDNSRKGGA